MGLQDKIKIVQKVSVNLSQTEKRDLAYRSTIEGSEGLNDYLKGQLGENADEHIKAVAKIAEETRTLLSPIVGLAIRTNPDKKEKYAEKGRRKEELMSEIIQLINAESKARAEAAAASRKDNQSKKSE